MKLAISLILTCLVLDCPLYTLTFDDFVWLDDVHEWEGNIVRKKRAEELPDELTLTTEAYTIQPIEVFEEDVNYYSLVYKSENEGGEQYWIDLDDLDENVVVHPKLSTSGRHAAKVPLSFTFPFYGHNTSSVLITSGGFLYAGQYIHKYLATTQYLAPLMANFDPSLSEEAAIRYLNRDDHLVVEWQQAILADSRDSGNFTFQITVYKNGTFVMAYKQIPVTIPSISSEKHPVKIGLADAYYVDKIIAPFFRRRTIYEYHRVSINKEKIVSNSAVIIKPLPTCNLYKSCLTCTNATSKFNCTWCESLHRCSDGFDRHRQNWVMNDCNSKNCTKPYQCPLYEGTPPPEVPTTPSPDNPTSKPELCNLKCENGGTCVLSRCVCPEWYSGRHCQVYSKDQTKKVPYISEPSTTSAGSHVGVALISIIIIAIIVMMVGWVVYAYYHPTTNSGLYLIQLTRYRPWRNISSPSPIYRYAKTPEAI